jgi:hypothetical protein
MKETIKSIIEWHEQTFPDATLEGQIEKFYDELAEYNEEYNIKELADMYIVACGIARFDSVQALDYFAVVYKAIMDYKLLAVPFLLREVIDDKMQINRKRKWGKQGNSYQHIEEGEEE